MEIAETLVTSPTAPPSGSAAAPPAQVPGYELLGELGRGGMGVVYKARQLKADRVVALKMILAGSHAGESESVRFRIEAEALARLQHPNIVGVYDVGEHEGLPFFSLEYCSGGSLDRKLAGTPLPPAEAAALVEKLARAMAAAHEKGVIHRDLKPANVLLGEDGVPKITDFGLAKKLDDDSGRTGSGTVMGTPSYMAPEQAVGKAKELGPACDIYSLGAVLYECLTGRPPFRAATAVDTLLQVVNEDPVPPTRLQPKTPRDLETICLKCLHKDPARRYTTSAALAEDCAAFLDGRPIQARAVGRWERLGKWVRRRPALAGLVLVSVLAMLSLLGGGWLFLLRTQQEKEQALSSLYRSKVGEARALRLARADGYKDRCWDLLREALLLGTADCDPELLRREAAGCLGDPVGRKPTVWTSLPVEMKAVAVHPDGVTIAAAAAGSLTLHRRGTDDCVTLHKGASVILGLAFVRSGDRLICFHADGSVRTFKQDGDQWIVDREFKTDCDTYGAVGGAPGREMLIAASANRFSAIDLSDGRTIARIEVPEKSHLRAFAPSPDGRRLAVAWSLKDVHRVSVWSLPDAEPMNQLNPNLATITRIAFSNDGRLLACGCSAGLIVYETTNFTPRITVGGDVVHTVAFSPDDRRIAFHVPQTGIARYWDLMLNRELAVFPHPAGPGSTTRLSGLEKGSLAFAADGSLVLMSDRAVHRRDLSGGPEQLVVVRTGVGMPDVAFHPDGTMLGVTCKDHSITFWDPRDGSALRGKEWSMPGQGQNIAFSPDGRLVAVTDWVGTLKVHEIASGRDVPVRGSTPGDILWSMEFSPDGRMLAVASGKGIQLWKVGAELQLLELLTSKNSRCICFSPDGRRVAWHESDSMQVIVHNLPPGNEDDWTVPGIKYDSHPRSTLFLADGRLATAGQGRIEIWDVESRERSVVLGGDEFIADTGITMRSVLALSHDGTRLAAVGDRVTIWDLKTNRLQLALPPESFSVWGLAWSHDDRSLAACSSSGALVIWRLESIRSQLAEIGLEW